MKNRWLDRAVVYGLQLTLCTTEDQFLAEIKRMTKRPWPPGEQWCSPGKACVHHLERPDSKSTANLVCIDASHDSLKGDWIAVAAMLAHEAVHVKQEMMRVIGEAKPSDEFEAYTVQNLVTNLLTEFQRQAPWTP